MNVLLISQCSKNALLETRRILDQFAERRGERSWQTAITQQGLETLYRLLRKTARKNTAVACHWIRGKDHTELLWIVGDSRQFNARGTTPTNTTQRDILRSKDENDWHAAEDIRLLARLAALFHDLGKASNTFQAKLRAATPMADPFRHEWVSLRLFEAFVGDDCSNDREWLERLTRLDGNASAMLLARLRIDGQGLDRPYSPFRTLRLPLARTIGWLIVSHHRLPTPGKGWELKKESLARLPAAIAHDWCGSRLAPGNEASTKSEQKVFEKTLAGCWSFAKGLPFDSEHWRQHVGKAADALLRHPGLVDGTDGADRLDSPHVLHLARLVLMLADHHYSAQPSSDRYGDKTRKGSKLIHANTCKDESTGERRLNQRLDEHLIGVEVSASRLLRTLPRLAENLPRIARHKGFRARAAGVFRWQNAAFDLAESLREKSARHGFFGVNLASTGCGKTLANARILYALAHPGLGARFTVALGLRTLTLQTGDAYRERLHLGPEDLAVLVGGAATRSLHAYYRSKERNAAEQGSESAQSLLPGHNHVRYEGSLEEGPLKRWLNTPQHGRGAPASSLLDAPVLVCTVDHLMPATEGTRGGHQILPMLRLMTSDLVLDEPDDFDIADLPALTRLVHWAGLLGSRVLLSSATLPPALVQGLFLAYRAGRASFQRHRGEPGTELQICCGWFDEFGTAAGHHGTTENGTDFLDSHTRFIDRRIARLTATKKRPRRAAILPLVMPPVTASDRAGRQLQICSELASLLQKAAHRLHQQHHSIDPVSGKRVSFGLIRMANIDPLFDVATGFFGQSAPDGCHIHLCAYHARHPVLVRAEIEKTLDGMLKRHNPESVFRHPELRQTLDESQEVDHLFIVLATAVAEVGRDHDYDWAVVEPSSMRSIIQLAGRVKRHREFDCPPDQPNILLLETNVKAIKTGGKGPAFRYPGFENDEFPLLHHKLGELLTPDQWQTIDARARIRPRTQLEPDRNLVDLEHARLSDLMLGAQAAEQQRATPVSRWWTSNAHLTGALQAHTRFRDDPQGSCTYYFQPDEDAANTDFCLLDENGNERSVETNLLIRIDDEDLFTGTRITPWSCPDYLSMLETLAEDMGMDLKTCALKFGTVDLPGYKAQQRWRYHPALGFSRA